MLSFHTRQHSAIFFGGANVPEIRTSVDVQLHRKLKAEAAREGVHLKDLIAKILEEHAGSKGGASAEHK